MANLMFYLASCSTCIRINKELDIEDKIPLQNIKEDKITPEQIDLMKELSGSYDSLFSKRAMKYKSMGLKEKNMSENDIRNLILEEYTFLKRPVLILNDQIFVGNSKKVVAEMKEALNNQ